MLKFREIIIDGMGPFKEPSRLVFPDEGVTIVYGENGHGKTSLLNAFRYAFFGKVLSRANRSLSIHNLTNWENARHGKYGFSVKLRFTFQNREYELIRTCNPRAYVKTPLHDEDYVQEYYLRRDGQILSPAERDRELQRIMPEEVSRFFLFDGELLQQYEELLRRESDMGREIAAAIERILGLPVLTKARSLLANRRDDAVRLEANAAQQYHQTEQLGVALQTLSRQREVLKKDLANLEAQLDEYKAQKANAEKRLSQHQVAIRLLEERDKLLQEIDSLQKRLPEKQARLREMLAEAWRWVLAPRAREECERLQAEIGALQEKAMRKAVESALIRQLEDSLRTGCCGTCFRPLDDETVMAIKKRIELMKTPMEPEDENKINELRLELAKLKVLDVPDQTQAVLELSNSLDEIDAQIALKRGRIDEIESEEIIKQVNETTLRKTKSDYEEAIEQIKVIQMGIEQTKKKLTEVENSIQDVQRKLSKTPVGGDLKRARYRREIYTHLHDLFDMGVAEYRDRLRTRVEKDATDLFLQLASDKDYVGLRINEHYGLTIVHRNGQSIVVRSAGYEHIVALSLIGALQRNAPLRGPVIMDSTFTRLDEAHSISVLRALPSLASQTMLLVFRREIDPEVARNVLLGKLKAEYRLERVSSFETRIVKQ